MPQKPRLHAEVVLLMPELGRGLVNLGSLRSGVALRWNLALRVDIEKKSRFQIDLPLRT